MPGTAFIGAIIEYPVASVLLTQQDQLTLAVGAKLFVHEHNFRWGDFAAAALLSGLPITDKAAFIARPTTAAAQLFFRSGGSSGTPALAGFSYRDFQRQMRAAADGLFAAGLDPGRDKVMNLFFSGSLYGGFFSFAKVLELLGATHLPMGAPADDDRIARTGPQTRVARNRYPATPALLLCVLCGPLCPL